MSRRTDVFDLGALALSSGEARRFDLEVETDPLTLGGESYQAAPSRLPVRLDLARTGSGYTLRLRFEAQLEGPCMRCLEPSGAAFEVDAREVHQEGRGEDPELRSPYVAGVAGRMSRGLPRDLRRVRREPERGRRAHARAGARPALGEALRDRIRVAPARTTLARSWRSPSRGSRTRARTSAARSTRSALRRWLSARTATPPSARTGFARPAGTTPAAR
jgi:hypothetical protein